jgi:uncharacterized protein with HEPN domain
MEEAEEFVDNWTFEEFSADLQTQFVVVRALEIIGEATKNILMKCVKNIPLFPGKIWREYGTN